MSNLDPFTQKLLERTQARKQAAKLKSNAKTETNNRKPLSERTNGLQQTTSPTKGKKRQSTDGDKDGSFEKKSKENGGDDEPIFKHRQASGVEYVVPSSAGCTPRKVNCGKSLSSRLAHLNQDYEEKFALDYAEEKRKKEAEEIQEQRREQHAKIQEEERQRILKEKIFGKERAAAMKNDAGVKKQDTPGKRIAPKPPSSSHDVAVNSSSPQKKRCAPVPPKKENVPAKVTPVKQHAPPQPLKQRPATSAKSSKMTVRKNEDKKEQSDAPDEESPKVTASVGTKMSIFEEKMKQEREARKKELEIEARLRQKTPRRRPQNSGGDNKDKAIPMTTSSSSGDEPSNEEEDVVFALTKPKESSRSAALPKQNDDAARSSSTREEHTPKQNHERRGSSTAEDETPKKSKNLCSLSSIQETPLKNYTGSLSSPQPIDCTEDTNASELKTFDISEILRAAEEEKPLSPTPMKMPRNDRTPMRSSTLKGETPVVSKPLIDIDLTPVQMDDDESEFAKALTAKANEILMEVNTDGREEKSKSKPKKPPRRHNAEFPPTYEQFIAAKKDGQIPLGPFNGDEDNNSDKAGSKKSGKKGTRFDIEAGSSGEGGTSQRPKERKKLRRSASFSEGQNSPVTSPVKPSGYNRTQSSKYDAHSSFDKPDIVHSKRDKIQNLLEKAACQQNIVLQTSQALNVAENSSEDKSGSPEVIEGERLLLLATEKRTACLEEVRQLKDTDCVEFLNTSDDSQPCKASLALTDLKLPLHHDFVGAVRAGRIDVGVFHFVVVASCGSKNVYCTKAVSSYDEMDGYSLIVNDNICLSEVPHDFTLTLKVYGLHTKKTLDHTSRTKRTHSTGQSSPGHLKGLFSKRKDDDVFNCASPQTVFRTSSFKLVGETKINLSMLGGGGKHVLTKVPSNCPLEGFIQLRVGCCPEFTATSSGFLTIQEDIGGYTAWNRRWCNMKDNKVLYWRYPDEEETKEPLGCIDLRYCTDKTANMLQRDVCARPQTFELNLKRAAKTGDESNLVKTVDGKVVLIKVWICADNKDDRVVWMDAINKQLSDSRAWLLKKTVQKYSKSTEEIITNDEYCAAVYL